MILVYSGGNSDDPHDFGGSIASFRNELTKRSINHVGFDAINGWKNRFIKGMWMIGRVLRFRKPFGWQFTKNALRLHSKRISKIVSSEDIVISFYQLILSRNFQSIQIIDCTLRYLFDFYPELNRISSDIISEALRLEKESYNFAKMIFVPNKLVKEELISQYLIPESKVVIASWSANNVSKRNSVEIVEQKCASIKAGIQILFIGKDFKRKRLDKAILLVKLIADSGVNCHLHVVGGDGSRSIHQPNPNVTFYGFLKNNSAKLLNLLEICHVGVLFSDGEATGISLLEFQKAGLVTISSGNGGTSSYLFTKFCFVDSSSDLSRAVKYILDLDLQSCVREIFTDSLNQGSQISGFDYIVEKIAGKFGVNFMNPVGRL